LMNENELGSLLEHGSRFGFRDLLLRILPQTKCTTHVHVQRPDNSELRNLDTVINDPVILLWNSFLLLTQKHDTFLWEFEVM